MIVMAGLIWLPTRWIVGIGCVMILGHNLLDGIVLEPDDALGRIWAFLHAGTWFKPVEGVWIWPAYPLVPWVGVMAVGYGFGQIMRRAREERVRLFRQLGIGMVAGFVVLRALNIYGDPVPWSGQTSVVYTILSFLNAEKYPPSLLFLLMTMGPAFLVWAWMESRKNVGKVLVTLGRVPLFYYVLHLILIHALVIGYSYLRYGEAGWWFDNYYRGVPEDYTMGLGIVYAVWIGVVALMYPISRWYAGIRPKYKLLRYL